MTTPSLHVDSASIAAAIDAAEQVGAAARRQGDRATWVPVSTRNNTGFLGLFGSTSTQTYFTKHYAPVDIDGLKLGYGNSYGGVGPSGDGPGNLAVKCSVILGTAIFRGYFNGSRTGTVEPGGVVETDEIGCYIPAGTFYFIATYVSGNWPTGLGINTCKGYGGQQASNTGDTTETNDSGEGIANPTSTDTTATGAKAPSTQVAYSPLYIHGRTSTPIAKWVIIGDSIVNGSDELNDMGWAVRALGLTSTPVTRASQPGETAQQWAVNGTAANLVESRKRLVAGGTHFIFAHGRNDVTGSRTVAQMQADLITCWSRPSAQGGVAFQSTVTPKVTTSDQYATLANQTIDPNDALRTGLNGWLRDGAPVIGSTPQAVGAVGATVSRCPVYAPGGFQVGSPSGPQHYLLGGVLDVTAVIESSFESGKFNVLNVRTVADAAITTGTKALTSATALFLTNNDLGKSLFIAGAHSGGTVYTSTITGVTSNTAATVYASAGTTVSGAAMQIGASTYDGTHPDGFWHRAIGAAFAPVFAAQSAAYLNSGV